MLRFHLQPILIRIFLAGLVVGLRNEGSFDVPVIQFASLVRVLVVLVLILVGRLLLSLAFHL